MGKIISIVGLALIVAAGLLASVATTQEDIIKANKELCAKYTANAESALKNKDFAKALKFAKQAIKVDPDNKSGYKMLEKIAAAQFAPAAATKSGTSATPAAKTPGKPTPAPASEEELGC
jgi:Tfp pilus assembly protein PilF